MLAIASQPVKGSSEPPAIDKNHIFIEDADGEKKSQIYGLDSCASSYYYGPVSFHSLSSGEMDNMQDKMWEKTEESA